MGRPILAAEYAALRQHLVQARERAGMTQSELAARLHRTQSFVSKYEMGERKLDVMDYLLICKVLRLDPAELLKTLA